MKNITKESIIKRNATIGRFATYGGLIVLAGGIFISFSSPEQITLPWVSLLAGFILTQVGLFYGNRWGRRLRPNEHLDDALKGLDDRYSIYHYSTPVSHLLLGPSLSLVYFSGKIIKSFHFSVK